MKNHHYFLGYPVQKHTKKQTSVEKLVEVMQLKQISGQND